MGSLGQTNSECHMLGLVGGNMLFLLMVPDQERPAYCLQLDLCMNGV